MLPVRQLPRLRLPLSLPFLMYKKLLQRNLLAKQRVQARGRKRENLVVYLFVWTWVFISHAGDAPMRFFFIVLVTAGVWQILFVFRGRGIFWILTKILRLISAAKPTWLSQQHQMSMTLSQPTIRRMLTHTFAHSLTHTYTQTHTSTLLCVVKRTTSISSTQKKRQQWCE